MTTIVAMAIVTPGWTPKKKPIDALVDNFFFADIPDDEASFNNAFA